jgi:hypothetical protein
VGVYVQWFDEENEETPPGSSGGVVRRHRAAWLLHDGPDESGTTQRRVLAYLGPRPAVTAALQEEVAALYPDLEVDWPAVRRAIAEQTGVTNVASLTDDDVILRLPALAQERGLSLADLSLRLGYGERQVLPELMRLVADAGRVGRFERTAGSVFDYMAEHHPEYAYLIYKARLFFEGEESLLTDLIAAEPSGYGDAVWQARRRFWQRRLEAYRRSRQPPA